MDEGRIYRALVASDSAGSADQLIVVSSIRTAPKAAVEATADMFFDRPARGRRGMQSSEGDGGG